MMKKMNGVTVYDVISSEYGNGFLVNRKEFIKNVNGYTDDFGQKLDKVSIKDMKHNIHTDKLLLIVSDGMEQIMTAHPFNQNELIQLLTLTSDSWNYDYNFVDWLRSMYSAAPKQGFVDQKDQYVELMFEQNFYKEIDKMEILTGKKVFIVKAMLGVTKGIIGVFDNQEAAERYAEEKYRVWTDDNNFTWAENKTAQTVNIKNENQETQLKGHLMISQYNVRSK